MGSSYHANALLKKNLNALGMMHKWREISRENAADSVHKTREFHFPLSGLRNM
jgi:hypothetical protein